jgi:hypothetical protein
MKEARVPSLKDGRREDDRNGSSCAKQRQACESRPSAHSSREHRMHRLDSSAAVPSCHANASCPSLALTPLLVEV